MPVWLLGLLGLAMQVPMMLKPTPTPKPTIIVRYCIADGKMWPARADGMCYIVDEPH